MSRTLLLTFALALATSTACSFPTAHIDEQAGGFRRVDIKTFRTERAADAFDMVLDVRTPAEFAGGHVPGAVNVPLDQLSARLDELSAHRADKVAVICQSGGRSLAASQTLTANGFTGVVDVEGGTGAWVSLGEPVTKGE